MPSIQYQNTAEDLKDFYEYYFFETKEGRQALKDIYKGYLSLVILTTLLIWGFLNLWIALGLLLLSGLVAMIMMGFHPIYWLAKRTAKKYTDYYVKLDDSVFTLSKQMEFTNEYFAVRNNLESLVVFAWKMIRKVEITGSYTYIFCGTRTFFILPLRAFPSKDSFNNFNKELLKIQSNAPSIVLPDLSTLLVL